MARSKTMTYKVSKASSDDDRLLTASENLARLLGIVFIVLGAGLIIFLIGGFVLSRLPYRVDPNLPIPTLKNTPAYSNKDALDVDGVTLPGEEVALYVNEERIKDTLISDDDGKFTFYDIAIEDEGEVNFESAVVRGGLFKRRSEFSNEVTTFVDWTPPSTTITLDFEETSGSNKTSVKGRADSNTTVILESENKKYEAKADENGEFTLDNLELSEGENVYTVRIRDESGNEVVASKTVEIAYVPGAAGSQGDINGPGASTSVLGGKLPESAGELEAALNFLTGNKMMLGLGLLALGLFAFSSGTVLRHARRNS